jgi:hypothetical protein
MTPKKVYYYDYRSTLNVEPGKTQPVPVSQPDEPVTTPETMAYSQPLTPPTPYPNQSPDSAPVERPKIIRTVLIIGLIVGIVYLIFSLLPKNFQSCTQFPGSKTTYTFPGTCTTFYRQSFSDSTAESTAPIESETAPESNPAPESTTETANESDITTNKGGLPITTLTPTPKTVNPTPTPSLKTGTATNDSNTHPNDWTKHNYPTQHLVIYLPPRFTSTNVIHHTDTGISNFTVYDGNNSVIKVAIQPNWANTGTAQNQAITFMLADGTGVIKLSNNNQSQYYFEKNNQVFIFTCTIDSNTCDSVIKTIKFI